MLPSAREGSQGKILSRYHLAFEIKIMKEKSTWSFQVVIRLEYPVRSWSPREKIKQMSGLFPQDVLLGHSPSKVPHAQHPGKGRG